MPQPEPFRFQTRIRFIDTDTSGRIHYTAMFRYFESAEIEFMRSLGISYASRTDWLLPRVHVECDFMLAMRHDDEIEIAVRLASVGASSIRFAFTTYLAGQVAATGAVVAVCMAVDTQRAAPIPEDLRTKLAEFLDSTGA